MKFPGYWVSHTGNKVVIEKTTFDETELDPASNWKQAWQNQTIENPSKGYVDLDAAMAYAASILAKTQGQ